MKIFNLNYNKFKIKRDKMNNKEEAIEYLENAKISHLEWVEKAKDLVFSNLDLSEKIIPVNSTECKFGKWFFNEGRELLLLEEISDLTEIESLHKELHEIYEIIFNIYYLKNKKSFIGNLFGIKRKIDSEDLNKSKKSFNKMVLVSEKLLKEIEVINQILIKIS